MASGVMDRCPTGIMGFDRMCQGGFIRNSDNLIVGGPGSGKSTFLLQFLWNGATMFGENGLYCSFEPDIVETLNDGQAHGWDFARLSNEGKIKFMKFSPHTSVEELKSELTGMVAKYGIRRICFDPISVLALNYSEQGKIREIIFELSSLMKRLKVTSILADESLEGDGMGPAMEGEWTKTDILRFLSDSVTVFYESGVTGVGDRAVRISKMRRTKHERKAQAMGITDKGIVVNYGPANAPPMQTSPAVPNKIVEETSTVEVIGPEGNKVNDTGYSKAATEPEPVVPPVNPEVEKSVNEIIAKQEQEKRTEMAEEPKMTPDMTPQMRVDAVYRPKPQVPQAPSIASVPQKTIETQIPQLPQGQNMSSELQTMTTAARGKMEVPSLGDGTENKSQMYNPQL